MYRTPHCRLRRTKRSGEKARDGTGVEASERASERESKRARERGRTTRTWTKSERVTERGDERETQSRRRRQERDRAANTAPTRRGKPRDIGCRRGAEATKLERSRKRGHPQRKSRLWTRDPELEHCGQPVPYASQLSVAVIIASKLPAL